MHGGVYNEISQRGKFLISNEKGENMVKKTMVFITHDMDEAFIMGDLGLYYEGRNGRSEGNA